MGIVSQLNALERAELIRIAQSVPEEEYLFRHALVQEAAYGSLLKSSRRDLHRAIGEAIEGLYPDRLDEYAPVLARHFEEAEQHDKALGYYARAGELAAARYANGEAVMHFEQALILLEDRTPPPGVSAERVYLLRGRALEMLGRYADADKNYLAMETLAARLGDRALELAAVNARGTIYSAPTSLHDDGLARTLGDRAVALARTLGDRAAESKALWNLALAYRFAGDAQSAVVLSDQSIAIARELGLREQLAFTLNDIGSVLGSLGKTERATEVAREAIALFRELGNLPMLSDSLNNLAEVDWAMGRLDNAEALTREALEIARAIGNAWGQGYSQAHLAIIAHERADFGAALRALDLAVLLAHASGFALGEQIALAMSAQAYASLGDFPRALERLGRLEKAIPASTGGISRSMLLAGLALAHAKTGDLERARDLIRQVEEVPLQVDVQLNAMALVALAQARLSIGDVEQTLETARQLQEFIARFGVRVLLSDAFHFEGRALRALGRLAEGYSTLARARAEALAIGSRRGQLSALLALVPLARELGKPDADSLAAEARELIAFVAAHAPPESRDVFLARPDVRALLA